MTVCSNSDMKSHQRRHWSCTPQCDRKAGIGAARITVLWAACAAVCRSEDVARGGNEVDVVEDVDGWDTSKTLVVNEVSGIRPVLLARGHRQRSSLSHQSFVSHICP